MWSISRVRERMNFERIKETRAQKTANGKVERHKDGKEGRC